MNQDEIRKNILRLLKEKASLKQTIFQQTTQLFSTFKDQLKLLVKELSDEVGKVDKRVLVEYHDKGPYQCELRVAGDVLIFYMHTNVFEFDKSHAIWKSSYVREDESRSYCGMIMIYNFLSDSFKYNRTTDVGYLIGRVFFNKDSHYFVDGKRQLGFIHNDFLHDEIDEKAVRGIILSAVLYCLEFDLYTPPFETLREVTVNEILEASNQMQIKTGKRLGFRFQAEDLGE
jgi:hypothetical protein